MPICDGKFVHYLQNLLMHHHITVLLNLCWVKMIDLGVVDCVDFSNLHIERNNGMRFQ